MEASVTTLYAVVLGAAVVALLLWVAAVAISGMVEGWDRVDPERRFGPAGRSALAGALGFGLAGMSATFAGWPGLAALAGAVGGAGMLVLVARRYGPGQAPQA
jgi:hypothetical protein